MSKKKKPDHVHEYVRMNMSRNPKKEPYVVLKCEAPACNHYMPEKFAVGKLAKCSRCGDPFIMDKTAAINHKKPHCSDCIKRKLKPELNDLINLANNMEKK